MQTAEIVARDRELSVVPIEALLEVDVGEWEGKDWGTIQRENPAAYKEFMQDPASNSYAGGESLIDVHRRAAPALRELLTSHLGRRVAVVAHNVVNRVFMCECLGFALSEARRIHQDNCGVNIVRFREGKSKAITVNATFHLGKY